MNIAAFGLILIAACIHAGWNLIAKRRPDVLAFYWAFTLSALVIYAIPFAILIQRHPPSREALPFLIASSLAEVGYGVFLALAYSRTDFSIAYPIARGTGVLLVPIAAVPIFGVRPHLLAWVGIGLIVLGVIWLHLPKLRLAIENGGLSGVVSWPPILTGTMIATYSLIDSAGVKRMQPFVYLYLTFVLIVLWMAPYILVARRAAVIAEFRQGWPVVGAGAAVFGAYCIVLAAYRLAPVSYVAPMREISIVIGTVLGVRLLKEPFGQTRIAACILVATGVIAIGISR